MEKSRQFCKILFIFLCLVLVSGIVFYFYQNEVKADETTVSVIVSVCGNNVIEGDEECDDGNIIDGDGCSSECKIEPEERRGGAIPKPPGPEEIAYYTRVILEGKAYPNVPVTIFKDGKFLTRIKADSRADFRTEIRNIDGGTHTFRLWAKDKNGLESSIFTITFYVSPALTTTVSNILLPPTISVSKNVFYKGENMGMMGQSIPGYKVRAFIYSEEPFKEIFRVSTRANVQGDWYYSLNADRFEEGIYQVFADSVSETGIGTFFSKALSFEIKPAYIPVPPISPTPPIPLPPTPTYFSADLNKDGKIEAVDASILLFWWGRYNKYADQNADGIIDLTDFSIMMYYWTG